MDTLAGLFGRLYRTGRHELDLSGVRLHITGADAACRALGARAMTIGADIYFRDGAFAPQSRHGLWLIAHEVAHVVQQACGSAGGPMEPAGTFVTSACSAQEQEADAAAEALIAGRPFTFSHATQAGSPTRPVIQRYMAWEHCLLGDLESCHVRQLASRDPAGKRHLAAVCEVLEALGRRPGDVDADQLSAQHPGLDLIRLPGSGLVVTLGELNILPDYLGHPLAIETASAAYLEPLIQSVRSWAIAELTESGGHRGRRKLLPGSLGYPRRRWQPEIFEALQVDAVGTRSGLAPWELYSSVVGRNAGHFAPLSWHRWRSFHLLARDLARRAKTIGGDKRDALVTRARIHAGYADHFLQDSFAAGHLINKTLVMQWYIEWLAGSRLPYRDRRMLERMTADRQPGLQSPSWYEQSASADADPASLPDPESVMAVLTLPGRIAASGVSGETEQERRQAYAGYLAMLASNVAQLAAGVVHRYLNANSLVVAAGVDGERFRLAGDYTLLTSPEGAHRAATAASASRRAVAELISRGRTDVMVGEVFDAFPDHVEAGGSMVPLRQWHEGTLRDLCFRELFGARDTRVARALLSASWRRLGVPASPL